MPDIRLQHKPVHFTRDNHLKPEIKAQSFLAMIPTLEYSLIDFAFME